MQEFLNVFFFFPTAPIHTLAPAQGGAGVPSHTDDCGRLYSIGTWNVNSMNHDKLEVVKQEMARVTVKILGN